MNLASTGGDGTTNATSGANAAYASINVCLSSEAGDLVTADENLVINCDGAGDHGTIPDSAWAGYTTDETRNITIQPVDADMRAGTAWDSNKFRIAAVAWQNGVTIGNTNWAFVRFDGIQFSVPGGGNEHCISTAMIYGGATPVVDIDRCFFRGLDTRSVSRNSPLVSLQATNIVAKVRNSVFVQEATANNADVRAFIETYAGEAHIHNNSMRGQVESVAGSGGISVKHSGAGTYSIKNNIIEADGGICYNFEPTSTPDTDANLTDDATSPDGASFQNLTATFAGTWDLALASGDTNAQNNGVDVSLDADAPVTIDIAGTSRPQGASFDIGAFEVVSAGGPITLTTEAGAWVAGGADSLLDRTLATEPGSHAWTGALSTLARALLTEPGAWTVAGALSDLVRALSTQPGAWAYSGQDSEFFIGLTLSTEPGTWTHAGIEAPILRGLATEPGAWAWAGQDSDLITGVVLVTEAGTWQLAGAEGLLIRNLDTEAGAHTWAGGDADLFTGIIIETEPGVWTLVGQLSDLPRNFDTEAGTWIQVGRDSSVVIPGQYYLEEAIAMAAQIIFDLRSNTTLTLDAGGANEVTNLRAIRQARSFDPNVGLRFVHSDETEFLIEKETPRDGAGDPIVGDVVLRRGMTLLDETNAESFVIRRIEYDRSGITRIGVVVP